MAANEEALPTPVTLLSGFLGAGKTTLLKHILANKQGLKVAVIVNDMAALNIDGALVANSKLVQREEKLVQMQNGCICCTLREDLVQEVAALAAEREFDCILIESTGISEPMQVAETFTFELPPDMQQRLNSPAAAGNKAGEHGGKGQDRVKGQDVAARDGDVPTSSKRTKAHAQQQGKPSAAAAAAEVRSVPRPGRRSSSGAADAISGSGKQDEKPKQGKKGQKPQGPGKEQQQQQQQQGATLGQGNEAQALVRAGKNGVGSDAMAAAALRTLSDFARLDTCVTVVDAATFFDNLHSIEELADRYGADVAPQDERHISNLLMEQVEFANVILLNKCDLVSRGQKTRVRAALKRLNPSAQVHETLNARVDLHHVLNTGMFNLEKAAESPGWLAALKSGTAPTPESDEYGISTFVYRARRPFHPGRLYRNFMEKYFLSKVIDVQDGPPPSEAMDDGDSEGGEGDEIGRGSGSVSNSGPAMSGSSSEERSSGDGDDGGASGSAGHRAQRKQVWSGGEGAHVHVGAEALDGDGDGEACGLVRHVRSKDELSAYQAARAEVLSRMERDLGTIMRSKGFLWLATLPDTMVSWGHAGVVLQLAREGPWFACVPKEEWPEDAAVVAQIEMDFDTAEPTIGDRRQELVFIGQGLRVDALRAALDACLVEPAEMMAAAARGLAADDDPLFGEQAGEDSGSGDGSSDESD